MDPLIPSTALPQLAVAGGGGMASVLSPAGATSLQMLTQLVAANTTRIEASVTANPALGLVQVMTSGGTSLDLRGWNGGALPTGASLTLQLQPQGDSIGVRVIAINGRPLASALPASPTAALPPPLPATATPSAPTPPTGAAPSLPAGAPASPSPSSPPGLTATVLRPAPAATATATATAEPSTPPLPPQLADLAPGSRIPVRIAAIGPQAPPPSMPGAQPAPLLPGTVIASGSAGSGALVQTAAGALVLPPGVTLPQGQNVWLEVIDAPQAPPPAAEAVPPAGLTARGWPALAEALDLLSRSAPDTATLVAQALPQPGGAGFAIALARFVLALRNGDLRSPGGTALTEALEKSGRRDLASQIETDVDELTEEAREPRGADGRWQVLTVPLLLGGQIEPVRLFVRRRADDEDGPHRQNGGGERRFLVEIDLTRLGRMQLDGLVAGGTKRFDLIVRTALPLPAVMRQDISAIFAGCAKVTGVTGGLSFQAGRGFVEVPPPAPIGTSVTA